MNFDFTGMGGKEESSTSTAAAAATIPKRWISYLDNLLQVSLLKDLPDNTTLRVPTSIRELSIREGNLYKEFPFLGGGIPGDPLSGGDRLVADIGSVSTMATLASTASGGETTTGTGNSSQEETTSSQDPAAPPLSQDHSLFVKIHKHQNKISSSLGDIVELKTSIMGRARQREEKAAASGSGSQRLCIGQKESVSVGEDTAVASQDTVVSAVELAMEYVKMQAGCADGLDVVVSTCAPPKTSSGSEILKTVFEDAARSIATQNCVESFKVTSRGSSPESAADLTTRLSGLAEELQGPKLPAKSANLLLLLLGNSRGSEDQGSVTTSGAESGAEVSTTEIQLSESVNEGLFTDDAEKQSLKQCLRGDDEAPSFVLAVGTTHGKKHSAAPAKEQVSAALVSLVFPMFSSLKPR